MRDLAQDFLRYLTLIAITVFAIMVMWWVSSKNVDTGPATSLTSPVPEVAQPKALVAAMDLQPKARELTATYTGKIRPWETFTLAFESPGRIVALGENKDGTPLDDGDRVSKGQLLARLDDRVFKARKSEAAAQIEEEKTELNRLRRLRERSPGAVSDSAYQQQLTQLALARAGQEVALKNFDDAILAAPVDATIARRMVNSGESVQGHQMAFELVQLNEVLLVVDVPESQIYDLQARQRAIASKKDLPAAEDNAKTFRAYITLEGRDRFGKRRSAIEGEVYRIAQVADARTGLFEVEIRIPNEDHSLRPGMVASAKIVTDLLHGYAIPETAIIFRNREAFLYAIDEKEVPAHVMFWDVGPSTSLTARKVMLEKWIDQGPEIIVPADDLALPDNCNQWPAAFGRRAASADRRAHTRIRIFRSRHIRAVKRAYEDQRLCN